jgi:hypothetical protein
LTLQQTPESVANYKPSRVVDPITDLRNSWMHALGTPAATEDAIRLLDDSKRVRDNFHN